MKLAFFGNPEDRFCRDEAQFSKEVKRNSLGGGGGGKIDLMHRFDSYSRRTVQLSDLCDTHSFDKMYPSMEFRK